MEAPKYLWWNGERRLWSECTVHVSEIAWATVGAVFEGIRAYWNDEQEQLYVFRLEEHMQRLVRSQKLVQLPIHYSVDELIAAALDLLAANETRQDTYIFPLAYTARTSTRRFRGASDSELSMTTRPNPTHLQTGMKLSANISSWRRISEDVMPPRAKNIANYRNSMLASLEAEADGYDTTILLNRNGNVSEAPGACVVMIRDGVLITPDLTSGILESITRDALLKMARNLGIEVQERVVDRTELYLADEVFTCGTAAEISPITSVDRYQIGNGELGPITSQLEDLFVKILRGQESDYAHWRTPVPAAVTA
ncbi:MAG: branched-chain amino acid transaminase [Thermomicrobiales bacterium]|nr:branched-chain amino acid transaminase [Thermomicrobiales bacterium]